MKVRSGFKQKRRENRFRSGKAVLKLAGKKTKKLLSKNLFTLNLFGRFKKNRPVRRKSFLNKDIHKKNYENPFSKKRKGAGALLATIKKKRFAISQILLIAVLIVWFTVLFVQPTLYIDRVKIEGNEEIQLNDLLKLVNEHLEKRNLLLIKRSHRFFLATDKLEEKIRERYGLESITFTPHWPSKSLHIKLKEKASVLAYSVDDNYYTIDRQGVIIRQLESFDELNNKGHIPVIYNFETGNNETVGTAVLTPANIAVITALHQELNKFTSLSLHSFRLKSSPKKEITIPNKRPAPPEKEKDDEDISEDLNELAQAIVNAETIDKKIETIEQLDTFKVEKVEEGEFVREIEKETVYKPDDDYQLKELEVYMQKGWSLKLGHEVLDSMEIMKKYLDIFATLNSEIDIEREVKEYIDLRFPNRVYYR